MSYHCNAMTCIFEEICVQTLLIFCCFRFILIFPFSFLKVSRKRYATRAFLFFVLRYISLLIYLFYGTFPVFRFFFFFFFFSTKTRKIRKKNSELSIAPKQTWEHLHAKETSTTVLRTSGSEFQEAWAWILGQVNLAQNAPHSQILNTASTSFPASYCQCQCYTINNDSRWPVLYSKSAHCREPLLWW